MNLLIDKINNLADDEIKKIFDDNFKLDVEGVKWIKDFGSIDIYLKESLNDEQKIALDGFNDLANGVLHYDEFFFKLYYRFDNNGIFIKYLDRGGKHPYTIHFIPYNNINLFETHHNPFIKIKGKL
ncbi:hypothetical protein LCGC14_0603050 [marine sediment metagenome]|uniref:Uncharacterized protein n=1 Tax=marine sediment metagenome TaxID=412755 RepID=A0A0F9RA29_9ZZZZ